LIVHALSISLGKSRLKVSGAQDRQNCWERRTIKVGGPVTMSDTEALEILRAQGYTGGTPDLRTGKVMIWIRGTDETVEVSLGRELHDLAEGKLSFEEVVGRREDEVVVLPD
jgi:hypothetical protein